MKNHKLTVLYPAKSYLTIHNIHHYLELMKDLRKAIKNNELNKIAEQKILNYQMFHTRNT